VEKELRLRLIPRDYGIMTEDLFRSSRMSMKVAALHFVDLPLSVYYSLPQVN